MQKGRRPRHIRDIAHLYLSRTRAPAPRASFNIVVVAEGRACWPGFHVANLAAALSLRNVEVRIYELSGLLPNVSFYFAHPPQRYLRVTQRSASLALPGLGDITISHLPRERVTRHEGTRRARINLIHLPPALEERAPEATEPPLDALLDPDRGETCVLALTEHKELSERVVAATERRVRPRLAFALTVKAGEARHAIAEELRDLGSLTNWEHRVAERVPLVLRNGDDDVARAYLSVCDSMLGQLKRMARRSDDNEVVGVTAGGTARR